MLKYWSIILLLISASLLFVGALHVAQEFNDLFSATFIAGIGVAVAIIPLRLIQEDEDASSDDTE